MGDDAERPQAHHRAFSLARMSSGRNRVSAVLCVGLFLQSLALIFLSFRATSSSGRPPTVGGTCQEGPPSPSVQFGLPELADPWDRWPAPLTHAPCRPKIFVYPVPARLQPKGAPARCADAVPTQYLSEVVLLSKIHEEPFASLYLTSDPARATHFLVPFYGACWLFTECYDPDGRSKQPENCGVDRQYVGPMLDFVQNWGPWWNRSGGSDHVFVHPMDRRLGYYTEPRLRSAISLVTNGDRRGSSGFRSLREIVIPSSSKPLVRGYIPEEYVGKDGSPNNRPTGLLFRGNFHSSHGLAPDDHYGLGVRWVLHNLKDTPGWVIGGKHSIVPALYPKELSQARFGVSPVGYTLDSTRLTDYLAFGVVPVVIADGIVLPFEDDVDWNSFIVKVRREDAHRLPQIIGSLPPEKVARMQRRGWEQYRFILCEYDAWHYIVRSLCRLSGISDPQVLPFNSSSHTPYFWASPHF